MENAGNDSNVRFGNLQHIRKRYCLGLSRKQLSKPLERTSRFLDTLYRC